MENLFEALFPFIKTAGNGFSSCLVSSELDKNHIFLFPWILQKLFAKGVDRKDAVLLIASEHSGNFFEQCCRRRGLSFQALINSKKVYFFDLLSLALSPEFSPERAAAELERAIQKFVEDTVETHSGIEKRAPLILIDSILPFLNIGIQMGQILAFLDILKQSIGQTGGSIILGFSNDQRKSSQAQDLYNVLLHSSHSVLRVSNLPTGQSADIDGQILIQQGHKFDILDTSCKAAYPFKSQKLLLKFKDNSFICHPCTI